MGKENEVRTGLEPILPPSAVSRPLSRRQFVQATGGIMALAGMGGLLAACTGSASSSPSGGSGAGSSPVASPTGTKSPVVFGFSHPFAEIPVVATVKQLVKGFGEEEGWKVLLDETQGGDLQDQLATIDTWLTQGITAMCIAPIDQTAFVTTAARVVDAGVIWTTYAFPMEIGAGGVLFSPQLSGEITGKATVEWINANDPEAEVLILELPAGGEARERTDVPKQIITEQTKATIVAVQGAADQTSGLKVTEDVLQAHPNVSVVVCHNDDGGLGAAEAFRKAGKTDPSKVWIVGQDGSEDALNALKAGDTFFRASAALDINNLCEEVVAVNKRAIERGWKPGDEQEYVDLTPTLLKVGDTELIDQFLKTYKS